MSNRVELLAPAGSMDSLIAAVAAGADAIYMGGSKFGARAYAENFTEEELVKAIDYAHLHHRKIYLTVNTLMKDTEMEELYDYLLPYYLHKLDGVIVQDLGAVRFMRRMFPDMEVHASTQMSLSGSYGAQLMKEQGLPRIVPARELSIDEIKKIKKETGIEIECFVHGALCYCYSGQCLLSSVIGGRSGNRGQCAQPCRLPYTIGGKTEDYMSLKDLCTIDLLPELIEAGIDSFKIEGRMKHPSYVYSVVSIYRKYIDLCYENPKAFRVSEKDRRILDAAFQRRGYTDGYYHRHNGKEMVCFKRPEVTDQLEILNSYEIKRPVSGSLYIRLGEPLMFSVYDDEFYVTMEGQIPSPAEKRPLDKERILKQMKKTGNTPFEFSDFTIDMQGDIFLPMQALNELRREGLDAFYQAVMADQSRTVLIEKSEPVQPSQEKVDHKLLTASVQTEEQLKTVLSTGRADRIYIDDSIALDQNVVSMIRQNPEVDFYYISPFIFRAKDVKYMDQKYNNILHLYQGILLRSMEFFGYVKEKGYEKKLISDYNLYTFNAESEQMMKDLGIFKYTLPVELNEKELKSMNRKDHTYIAYGYQPVMITANCLVKTSQGCKHQPSFMTFTDRYKNDFLVYANCRQCYNVIYNTSPLYLADLKSKLTGLGVGEYRLDFVRESVEQVSQMIDDYYTALFTSEEVTCSLKNITRGHLKRGVK